MITKLQIANLALRHLAMRKLDNLSGVDPSTLAINDVFDPCRNDILTEHQWPFATVQQLLVESSEDVPQGWLFAYEYPESDVAKIWRVFNEATSDNKEAQDFEVLLIPDDTTPTKIIVSNLDVAYAEYTFIVTDPTLWDAKFDMVLSYRLAATLAHTLIGDADKGLKLMAVYNAMLSELKRVNAAEQRKKPQKKSDYQSSRG